MCEARSHISFLESAFRTFKNLEWCLIQLHPLSIPLLHDFPDFNSVFTFALLHIPSGPDNSLLPLARPPFLPSCRSIYSPPEAELCWRHWDAIMNTEPRSPEQSPGSPLHPSRPCLYLFYSFIHVLMWFDFLFFLFHFLCFSSSVFFLKSLCPLTQCGSNSLCLPKDNLSILASLSLSVIFIKNRPDYVTCLLKISQGLPITLGTKFPNLTPWHINAMQYWTNKVSGT